ncbi:MAG TPA: phosphotransferase, partial [Myxococcota bacterium]|nr:phosphotransferase [Myxococcota bacterium]
MAPPEAALAAWDWAGPVEPRPASSGLINASWTLVGPAGAVVGVLQRLNTRVFRATVHEDIAAITAALAASGLTTPRLVATRAGRLYADVDGEVWRVLTPVGSRTIDTVGHPDEARSAGALVARFHAALTGFDWTFRHVRPGAHDTDAHLRALREAVETLPSHRLRAPVARLADDLGVAWERLRGELPELPTRIIHGDLKLSNLRFDGREAVALIDLDTLAHGTLDVELGDALRSWCGAAGEDVAEAAFDLDVFEAAMAGYASG